MEASRIRDEARSVWAKVLQTDVSDSTDFFDKGGHSFAAMRITVLLDEALNTETPARLLFDHPLFEDYVNALTESLTETAVQTRATPRAGHQHCLETPE